MVGEDHVQAVLLRDPGVDGGALVDPVARAVQGARQVDPAAVGGAPAGQFGEVVVEADAQTEADPAEFEAPVAPARLEDLLLMLVEVLLRVRRHVRAIRVVDQRRDGGARAAGGQGDVHRGGDPGGAQRIQPGVVGGRPQARVGGQRGQLVAGERELGEHHQLGALFAGRGGEARGPRDVGPDVGGGAGQLRCGDLHRVRMPDRRRPP